MKKKGGDKYMILIPEDIFRKNSRKLTDAEIKHIDEIKTKAEELYALFNINVGKNPDDQRCIALAKTNLEQSIMWAVKGITK